MLSELSGYTTKLLCLSIWIGIIQMLLPQSKVKQNVLFVCMMVALLTMIEPIIHFFDREFDLAKIYKEKVDDYELKVAKQEFENHYETLLKETFEENLQVDIISRLRKAGYEVHSITCEIDEITFEPKSLTLEIEAQDGFIQPVTVEVSNGNQSSKTLSKIEEYQLTKLLIENYGFPKENVVIKGR